MSCPFLVSESPIRSNEIYRLPDLTAFPSLTDMKTRETEHAVAKPGPNPLWAINVGMAVFFAAAAALIAAGL